MILFFDIETSDKADFKAPFTAEHQPNLVQLGAMLCDESGAIVHQFEFIVKPTDWEISRGAFETHGLSTDYCRAHGVKLSTVLNAFNMLCNRASLAVAFNIDFDELVMTTAYHRSGGMICPFLELKTACGMKPLTNVCRIPGPRGFKWPSLPEAHRFFFNEDFDGAHGALVDTGVLRMVYLENQRRQAAVQVAP